jgi:hypothetical protein
MTEATFEKFMEKLDTAVDKCPSTVCKFFTLYALQAALAKGEEEFKSVLMKAAEYEAQDNMLKAALKAKEN